VRFYSHVVLSPERRIVARLLASALALASAQVLVWMLPPRSALATATADLTGRVTDQTTGAGLAALITVVGGGRVGSSRWVGQTDSAGRFTLTLAPGTVTVTPSRSGYYAQERTVALSAGTRAVVNFALSPMHAAPTPTPTPRPVPTPTAGPSPAPSPAPTPVPAPTASGGAYRVPSSIAANCSVDVTGDLLAWIATVPNNATLVFPAGGCYRIDASLRIQDRWGLTFEGNGTTFRAVAEGDQARRHFWFWGGGNLVLRNLIVRGANPNAGTAEEAYRADREFQHAFALQGVQGALLDQVQAYDVYGDFVYIGPDYRGTFTWSRQVTVQKSRFERNGRQGIAIVAAEDVVIADNFIGGVRRATFNMEPTGTGWGARRVRIVRNTTGRGRLLWLSSSGRGYNVNEIYIAENTMTAATGTPVVFLVAPEGGMRGPITIENNTLIVGGSPAPAFRFTRVTGILIRNNRVTLPARREMTVVALTGSARTQVLDNAFCGGARVLAVDELSWDYYEANNVTVCP